MQLKRKVALFLSFATALVACDTRASDAPDSNISMLEAPLDSIVLIDAPEIATEIGDGIIVLPSPTLPGIVRIDFASGRTDSAGRAGDGPGEFRSPFFVQRTNNGAVLVLDGLARRVTVLDSSLAFREQFVDFGGLPPFALRFDTVGNSYSVAQSSGPYSTGDSLPLLRRRASSAMLDTIANLQRLALHPLQSGTNMMMVPAEYAPRDLWGVFANGTVWVARGERREVELISVDGAVSRAALPFAPIATVDADRKLFRGLPAPSELDTVTRTMAPTKGPFQEVRPAPDGHLYFWLNQPAGYTRELIAEFDAKGALLRTISLPLSTKLVLAGRTSLYTTYESADGTWILRRHRRPS